MAKLMPRLLNTENWSELQKSRDFQVELVQLICVTGKSECEVDRPHLNIQKPRKDPGESPLRGRGGEGYEWNLH